MYFIYIYMYTYVCIFMCVPTYRLTDRCGTVEIVNIEDIYDSDIAARDTHSLITG